VQGESDYQRNVRVQTGIANPIPALELEREKIAMLTPIKRPEESSRGPPGGARIDRRIGLDHADNLAAAARRQPALSLSARFHYLTLQLSHASCVNVGNCMV
jgi:hypothetical protein